MNSICVLNELISEGKISERLEEKTVIVEKNDITLFRGGYQVRVETNTNWYNVFIDFELGNDGKDTESLKKDYGIYSTYSTSYYEMKYDNGMDALVIMSKDKSIKVTVLL